MHRYKKLAGLTIIEIMTVLLIIGIIASVSVPIYRDYLIKSRFTEAFTTMNQYKNNMAVAYIDYDEFPSSYDGLTSGAAASISSAVLKVVYYGRSADNRDAYLNFYTLDLGVPGYVEPDATGANGTYARITIAAITTGAGHLQFYCGQWDGADDDVPLEYLPKNCQDTNISSQIS